jgi:glutamate dehydrogenase (NAD(P)+)
MDEYSAINGYTPGIVTGKPVELGGSAGRNESPGRGAAIVGMLAAKDFGISSNGLRVVVQGYGQVGSSAARKFHADGATVMAVSDVSGGIYNPKGLDIPALDQLIGAGGRVAEFRGGEKVTNSELLCLETDVLAPAAIENVITSENAPKLRAKMVVEGANQPTSVEGDRILRERGIVVVPDILANAGGVVVSYFEWAQNIQVFSWDLERVNSELDRVMERAYTATRDFARAHEVSLREAAYDIAVERVTNAIQLRGFLK